MLPSGGVVDMLTIKRHLLNTPNDPFTRAPLSLDMVKPDLHLKVSPLLIPNGAYPTGKFELL